MSPISRRCWRRPTRAAAGGLLAFTPETHAGEGVILGRGLRYAHAAAYVRDAVEAAGLKLSLLEDLSARNEDNAPVPGLVAVAAKTCVVLRSATRAAHGRHCVRPVSYCQ